jgi:hypothetical protein
LPPRSTTIQHQLLASLTGTRSAPSRGRVHKLGVSGRTEKGFVLKSLTSSILTVSGRDWRNCSWNITKKLTTALGLQQQNRRRWCRKQSMAGQNIFRGLRRGGPWRGRWGVRSDQGTGVRSVPT